jgi:hypothetical protein
VKRGWGGIALRLSVGVNLGLIAGAAARRRALDRWEAIRAGEMAPPERPGHRIAERLGLDEAERERFVAIQHRLVERTLAGRRRVAELRRELRPELLAERPDRARVEELLAELAREEAALDRAFVDSVIESRAVPGPRRAEAYLAFLERFAPGRPGPPHAEGGPFGARRRGPS